MEDNLVSRFACRLAFHLERFHDLRLVWHLGYRERPLWLVILASWCIALPEYCFAVPANRLGSYHFSGAELKAMQEVITLSVFAIFSVLFLGQPLTLNHVLGFGLIALGAAFVFNGPF